MLSILDLTEKYNHRYQTARVKDPLRRGLAVDYDNRFYDSAILD